MKFAGCLGTEEPPLVIFGWLAVVNGGTTRITWPALYGPPGPSAPVGAPSRSM